MPRYINVEDALQAHPEFLNEQIDDHDKAVYAKGRNACNSAFYGAIKELPTVSPDDLRPVGKWEDAGKQMLINLENAREQYSVLGYPHRTELKRRCSVCRKITLVDASIEYKYCPHCGAKMKGE